MRSSALRRVSVLEVGRSDVPATVRQLEARSDVLYAEPNYLYSASSLTPNDPAYVDQWGLGTSSAAIGAPTAWGRTTGSSSVTIAVVDSGVDLSHPDLSANLWQNGGEIPGNGLDDDLNGHVDDSFGWDWVGGDADPTDLNGHGTHVAGIAGARGNDGVGIAGTAWQSKLMALRALDHEGIGTSLDIALAFRYAASNGAKIVNASLGGGGYSQTIAYEIAAAPGTLFVTAAGNGGADSVGDDNDSFSSYPCNLSLENVVCVAASDKLGQLASFSNFGDQTVDLAAPGTSILSTIPATKWAYGSGTSMATPFVAGAAALLWSAAPGATVADVRQSLLGGVTSAPSSANKLVSGGNLNVAASLELLVPSGATPSPTPTSSPTVTPTPTSSPTPTPEPTPSPTPTPEPSPSPTPTADPSPTIAPPPEPVEPGPVAMTAHMFPKRFSNRLVATGWLEPQGEGSVKVVLKRRAGGRWRLVAKKFTSLERSGETRSVFKKRFSRPSNKRCRLIAVITAHDQRTRLKRTFDC